MKWLAACVLIVPAGAGTVEEFIAAAAQKHGDLGERAAEFLVESMPAQDREALDSGFLMENLDLALKARETFPWASEVPEALFFNDVLPYAVFDEPRDPWRAEFLEMATPIVEGSETTTEAAQALNREFFKLVNTHYHTERKRTNQSPKESIEQGRATCTGLSILMVDVCRAVGIPARAVGTPMWSNGRGNHTWVEIWDGDWHFTGADEFDEKGLDRGWFTGDAAEAQAEVPEHAIYATSWKKTGLSFPMVWSPSATGVPAVNVTARYAKAKEPTPELGIRLWDVAGERVAREGWLTSESGRRIASFTTKGGTADLNDLPRVPVVVGQRYRLWFPGLGETESFVAESGQATRDVRPAEMTPLSPALAALAENPGASPEIAGNEELRVIALLTEVARESTREARQAELDAKKIVHGEFELRWMEREFGDAPAGERSLWISMHGGGGTTQEVNDQQWQNQIGLYEPAEGIYVAPRAPTNSWNMWHQDHIDPLFSRLIEDMVALRGVDPDKVYLMGYSAGGDGVWQVAPRMADRFAAASMMAGHPNEASLLPLRDLPFAVFMGGEDAAYDRNRLARERIAKLDQLEADDPEGYVHLGRVYEGLGHWMERKDAEAVPWMAQFTRQSWPERVVWVQDDVTHSRFYWLELPEGGSAAAGDAMTATREGQTIQLEGKVPTGTRVLLGPGMVDLEQPLTLRANGQETEVSAKRDASVIRRALAERLDPKSCPVAEILVP
ncbi:putative esterase [Haloferula luteola]|uniref:Putative esterase n=1 Tax=Haloferula luteola TaxID=595692 RepID=A0A840V770_9BACT|nr:transglutaminase domain-containing protein [Haloferula luteola]MBB5352886.1 putative esterase [Haloferula luteola]